MEYNVFMTMPLKALILASQGFMEKEQSFYRNTWEQARLVAFNALVAGGPYKSKPKITDVIDFPWDKEEEVEQRYKTPVIEKYEDVGHKWFPHLMDKTEEEIEEDGTERR